MKRERFCMGGTIIPEAAKECDDFIERKDILIKFITPVEKTFMGSRHSFVDIFYDELNSGEGLMMGEN